MNSTPHQKEREFRRNWESMRSPAERRAALAEELGVLDRWLARLEDPEQGAVGTALRSRFSTTGCKEEIRAENDPDEDSLAAYILFSYNILWKRTYFLNLIEYGYHALASRAQLLSTRIHEMVHAIQHRNTAALHARAANYASPVLLCPRDAALLVKFMEQEAYTKQTWLTSLALHDIPADDPAHQSAFTSLFAFMRRHSQSLEACLTLSSGIIMDIKDEEAGIESIGQRYCHKELLTYSTVVPGLLDDIRSGKVILARLEPEDIWEVGKTFGPNIFGPEKPPPGFLKGPDLTKESQSLLHDLNEALGITDENSLPTFREALRMQGVTPAQLIQISYTPPPTMWQVVKQFFGLG